MIYHTYSSDETEKNGFSTALRILNRGPLKSIATTLALTGDLGAGKTTWVRGFLRAMNKKGVTSPTFVLMKKFNLGKQNPEFKTVYHWDWYRLKNKKDLDILNFPETLVDSGNIILIEWPEQVAGVLPKNTIRVGFKHGKKEHERTISVKL